MQNHFLLGVSVGEAFAEYCLLDGHNVISIKRAYLTRENLKTSLTQFVATHKEKAIQKAAVSLRVPEKLLELKYNSPVAHVITAGFEHWLNLHPPHSTGFTTENHQFPVHERILANGKVAMPIAIEELEIISAKLKELGTQKVCIHFLHASLNPVHQNSAFQYFQDQGFEVFIPEITDDSDEVSRWKKNALKATAANLFRDLKKEIQEALDGSLKSENIHYLNATGNFSAETEHDLIAGLSASFSAMALARKNNDADILYLGLENFVLISPKKWNTKWQSSWGEIENRHVAFRHLQVQPTLAIEINDFHHFDFSTQSESWEPGPMSLGRGQKTCLLDLWAENSKLSKIDGLRGRIVPAGILRFKNSMFALSKISSSQGKEFPHISKELQSLAMQKLALETLLFRDNKKMIITGPLAELFGNVFKKDRHAIFESDEFVLSKSIAMLGQSLLKTHTGEA